MNDKPQRMHKKYLHLSNLFVYLIKKIYICAVRNEKCSI